VDDVEGTDSKDEIYKRMRAVFVTQREIASAFLGKVYSSTT